MNSENPWVNLGGLYGIALIFTLFGVYLWQAGLKVYESAGS